MRHKILANFREEGEKLLLICRGIDVVRNDFDYIRVRFQKRLTELFAEVLLGVFAELLDDGLLIKLEIVVEVRQVVQDD